MLHYKRKLKVIKDEIQGIQILFESQNFTRRELTFQSQIPFPTLTRYLKLE